MKGRELLIGIICLLFGALATFLYTQNDVQSNKKLVTRILKSSINSMEASQSLANSCSAAYSTATNCVTNLRTCNLQQEVKKLDTFNSQKKEADKQIELANIEIQKIIEEVSANR